MSAQPSTLPPPRYLVCHLPGFRLERCGWASAQPAALVAEQRSALRIQAASPAASRRGVRSGMSLSQARALLPELEVELLELDSERADLAELARQLLRVSPAVLPLPPDAIAAELGPKGWADTRHPLEWELLRQARRRLQQLGHRVQAVVAGDLFAARILARWGGRPRVVPAGGLAQALAELPIEALEPSPAAAILLRELGLRRVEQLAVLPASAVVGRLGAEGARLHRLAQGQPRRSLSVLRGERAGLPIRGQDLPFPVTEIEPLLFVINRLCRKLCADLHHAGQALVAITLELQIEDAPTLRLAFRTGQPGRDPERLSRLLRQRLEGVQAAGPVLGIALEATQPVPFAGAQEPLPGGCEVLEPLPGVLARLADALGPAALFFPEPRDRWLPEAAWAPVAALDHQDRVRKLPVLPLPGARRQDILPSAFKLNGKDPDPAWPHEAWRLSLPLPRPALLLAEPRPVLLQPRLGSPRRVQLEGRWLDVQRACGHERLCGEWWAVGLDRGYLRLELADGRVLWVYRELGHAYLHGLFDQGAPAVAGAS